MSLSFQDILNKYREISFSEHDKGNRFEKLMKGYLLTDPVYSSIFKDVWMWDEFFGKDDLGGIDTGIDLIGFTVDGDYWAIQCKCYSENAVIDKPAVDSFLSTSGRKFRDKNLRTTGFSHRLWISTTNKWGSNATQAIKNQDPPVTRINLYDLQEAVVDWQKLEDGIYGDASRNPQKSIRPHQQEALDKTHEYFKNEDRGKLIMACGTGKTFNSLRIAENETNGTGFILFLVPSIALLGQALKEWFSEAKDPIKAICICSDEKVSSDKIKKFDSGSFSTIDLALPASTDVNNIIHQLHYIPLVEYKGMTVVFSTYQSIEVISQVQKKLIDQNDKFGEFDLIICDEAHRTTGVTLSEEDSSSFVKVHDNNFIRAKKRLYMTATPRLYNEDVKTRAEQADAVLCSMDDPKIYGEEIYRIGFGEAVEKDLLTDYKVLVLTVSDKDVPPNIQKASTGTEGEINTDDVPKLIGCINALSKQILGDEGLVKESDPEPMKRAVAFCQTIADSKKITEIFDSTANAYVKSLPNSERERMVSIESKHIDGTMSAPERNELMSWLKAPDIDNNECRVLTNVRCLSEGVDVPSLDAVVFLSPRNSQVDVVQSVGRVMRKSPGKKYGYIIIPIVIPSDVEADKALDNNDRYKVVWSVLNALRAHDDRFNATVNKIELNKNRPAQISVGRGVFSFDDDGKPVLVTDDGSSQETAKNLSSQLSLQFNQLQNVVFAKMVKKVGDRTYWEQWAKNIAEIAERQAKRISQLVKEDASDHQAFNDFVNGLRKNINPSITEQDAIEMLSQHIITKPVFEALFEKYSFVKNNSISISMQKMLDLLEGETSNKDLEVLQKFYESVKKRTEGINNAEGKQRIIIELYDKFFKTAFPKTVERLGIVYTPVEIVDFIIHSVNEVLQKEFNCTFTDDNVHILDPFTGTGTFITRLLQSGLIESKDLKRKYESEIHANEIVLLAYYIAAVNIENVYHDLTKANEYKAFNGICLTDTFQLGETDSSERLFSKMFPQNSEQVQKQKKSPIRVIISNPPYSAGQKAANDNAQNQKYDKLDSRIAKTYAFESNAILKNSLYDSYIKAFRWSTDRLDPQNGGIIAFVSNGSWLDSNSTDGFRKCLEKEFSTIYIFNTRGNARTQGELRRKEAGNVFGGGSRTPISITLLVKNPKKTNEKAQIYYHEIEDYKNREEKINIIKNFSSISNSAIKWDSIYPNKHGDWISQRNDLFSEFIELGKNKNQLATSFFTFYSNGLKTNRDAWSYNSSTNELSNNINKTINFFNKQVDSFIIEKKNNPDLKLDNFIDTDSKNITWDYAQKVDLAKYKKYQFQNESITNSIYRPFFNQKVYFNRSLINRVYQLPKLFPQKNITNKLICVPGNGSTKDFSVLMVDKIPDLGINAASQCFPLNYYEEREKQNIGLFEEPGKSEYICKDGVSDFILNRAKKMYGKNINKEDIFYYVYGFLHSPEYKTMFSSDLKKMLPRIPLVEDLNDFWKFSKAGRKLGDLHINYEKVPAYNDVEVTGEESNDFRVDKMRFPKKNQKDTIIYNNKIIISKIPVKAYEYIVNGKSAIEWIMERYQVTTNKDSGIKNDPNDWAEEVGNPKYILDLLLSIINVSVQTVDIVNSLPKLDFKNQN